VTILQLMKHHPILHNIHTIVAPSHVRLEALTGKLLRYSNIGAVNCYLLLRHDSNNETSCLIVRSTGWIMLSSHHHQQHHDYHHHRPRYYFSMSSTESNNGTTAHNIFWRCSSAIHCYDMTVKMKHLYPISSVHIDNDWVIVNT
jgi:hypothetical protein